VRNAVAYDKETASAAAITVDVQVTRRAKRLYEACWSLGIAGLQSIDKMRLGLLDAVDLMDPAQHQLGQSILV